jgi:hypothetical protein
MLNRDKLQSLWADMWAEGNWVPSFPDSLAGLTAEQASCSPRPGAHSIWQEVVHVTFWRRVTLRRMAGGDAPSDQEIERDEFAVPEQPTEADWAAAMAALKQTQDEIAAAIQDPATDLQRVPYHLIHDAYHLGRITQLRAMEGTAPKF